MSYDHENMIIVQLATLRNEIMELLGVYVSTHATELSSESHIQESLQLYGRNINTNDKHGKKVILYYHL